MILIAADTFCRPLLYLSGRTGMILLLAVFQLQDGDDSLPDGAAIPHQRNRNSVTISAMRRGVLQIFLRLIEASGSGIALFHCMNFRFRTGRCHNYTPCRVVSHFLPYGEHITKIPRQGASAPRRGSEHQFTVNHPGKPTLRRHYVRG